MSCQQTKNLIPLYLDDALETAERQRVADHLRTCADCRAEARKIEAAWELLGAVKGIEPAPGYHLRFWRSVDARRPWYARAWRHVQAVSGNQRWIPAAAAAAIVLLIGGLAVFQYPQKPQMPAVLTALNEIDVEMFANIELIEDYEIIQEFDFFADFEVIENLDGQKTS